MSSNIANALSGATTAKSSALFISSFTLDEHAVMNIKQSNVKAICISGLFFIESKW